MSCKRCKIGNVTEQLIKSNDAITYDLEALFQAVQMFQLSFSENAAYSLSSELRLSYRSL